MEERFTPTLQPSQLTSQFSVAIMLHNYYSGHVGAIHVVLTTIITDQTTFSDNRLPNFAYSSNGNGGAIHWPSPLTITTDLLTLNFIGNSASYEGAIYASCSWITIVNMSSFNHNTGSVNYVTSGEAIYGAVVTVVRSALSNNTSYSGGAIIL